MIKKSTKSKIKKIANFINLFIFLRIPFQLRERWVADDYLRGTTICFLLLQFSLWFRCFWKLRSIQRRYTYPVMFICKSEVQARDYNRGIMCAGGLSPETYDSQTESSVIKRDCSRYTQGIDESSSVIKFPKKYKSETSKLDSFNVFLNIKLIRLF